MKKIIKKTNITKIEYLVLYFTIYSIIGYLLETAYALHIYGHFVNRGFLFGPLCPIYGFGGVMLITFLKKYKKNYIKLFFLSAIIFTAFEFVAGFALDALFAAKWWDYSDDYANINGRVCLAFSVIWGICGIVFINIIHPSVEKYTKMILKKMSSKKRKIAINIISIAILTDFILSSLNYLNVLNLTNG